MLSVVTLPTRPLARTVRERAARGGSQQGHTELMELLLADKRMDPNKANDYGNTAATWAAEKGHTDIMRLLLADKRVNPNLVNDRGRTPLMYAAVFTPGGSLDICK